MGNFQNHYEAGLQQEIHWYWKEKERRQTIAQGKRTLTIGL